ncbi:MAG: hypothetical protein ACJ72Z_01755 [Pyrinomonadaceae bacterium]
MATIAFNLIATAGLINGLTPKEVSDKYLTPVTPAGYAFSIWSLIYAGLIAFSVYQFLPANRAKYRNITTLYILTCLLNCSWVYFWHHEQIVVCFVLIFLLAISLFFINRNLRIKTTTGEYWLVKAPFSLYFGWVTAATLVSFAISLVYMQVKVVTGAAIFLIAIASLLGLIVRFKSLNYLYPLAIAWALTAIAVKQSGNTAIVVACAAGVVCSLIATLSFVVNLPSQSTSRTTAQ